MVDRRQNTEEEKNSRELHSWKKRCLRYFSSFVFFTQKKRQFKNKNGEEKKLKQFSNVFTSLPFQQTQFSCVEVLENVQIVAKVNLFDDAGLNTIRH